MKPRIFVSRKIPTGLRALEGRGFEVSVWSKRLPPTRKELIENAREADALLSLLSDKIDAGVLNECKKLKMIAQYAVGYDNIDLKTATEKGIVVTNTPDVLTDTTADLAFALLLAVARRIHEADRLVRKGKWVVAWEPSFMLGVDVHHKTLGIIGFGRIGREVAKRGKGFCMNVLYYDVKRNEEAEEALGAKFAELDELLRKSDFVSIHVSLNPGTRHLIGARELGLMKKTAFLINTARGAVVDEKALFEALKEKRIAGAGLDVFEKEPINSSNPLTKLNNVVLTPHIGSASRETRNKMAEMAVENIIAFFSGKKPPNVVNPEVLEKIGLR